MDHIHANRPLNTWSFLAFAVAILAVLLAYPGRLSAQEVQKLEAPAAAGEAVPKAPAVPPASPTETTSKAQAEKPTAPVEATPKAPAGKPAPPGEATSKTQDETKPKLVTNIFFESSLRQALSDISAQTGVIIVPDTSVQGIVTCDLKDVPVEEALDIVLSVGNFAWRQMDGYILVGEAATDGPSFMRLSETQNISLNYVKPEEAVKMLSEPLRKFVRVNSETSSVSVTAPRAILQRVVGELKALDKAPRHVLLETRVVSMETGNLLQIGLRWEWPTVSAGAFSDSFQHGKDALAGGSWPWGIRVGYTPGKEFTNSLLMALSLLAQNDEALIVANPQVMALDGKEAKVSVTTEEYFQIIAPGAYYVQAQLEKIEAGTLLKMTPRISDNNDIVLEISSEVSDVAARGQNNLPVVTRRNVTSTVRVQDGGTVAMAGLMDDRNNKVQSSVPGLGSIPLLGYLFRDSDKRHASRQVCVFITAYIVSEAANEPPKAIEKHPAIRLVGDEFRQELKESLIRLKQERE